MKIKLLAVLLLAGFLSAHAQIISAPPTGASIQFKNSGTNYGSPLIGVGSLNFSGCTVSGTSPNFTITCSGGGSGTVSQANPATDAGTATNLGTFGFSSQTTTPTLTFNLTAAPAHKYWGNNTGSSAAPNYLSIAAADLPASVPTSVVNDTNVTGSIAANALTLSWTGTLAAGRLNANTPQSIVNDTNVTGSIAAQALSLGWTGTLAKNRIIGTAVFNDQANTFSTGDQNFSSATSMELPNTQAGAANTSTTDQGGQDVTGAATGTQGGKTIRGADISNAGGSNSNAAGGLTLRGGDNANLGTGGVESGGPLTIRCGATTDGASGTDAVPGYCVFALTYRKGTTYTGAGSPTGGLLGAITGHNTIQDLSVPALPFVWVGVNLPAVNTTGAVEQILGEVTPQSKNSITWTNGDIVCTDTTNYGYVLDNGTNPCACPSTQVGVVDLTITGTATLITLTHQGVCVSSIATSSHKWINGIAVATGLPTLTQPDTSDLTGMTLGPTVNTATGDVICDATNTSPFTCTGVSTTETYFAAKTTIPTAATANLIDGTHHGMNLSTMFDMVYASSGGPVTLKLNACTSLSGQTCAGRVTIWTGNSAGSVGAITPTNFLLSCMIFTESTATSLNTSCTNSVVKGFAPNTNISSVVASVPNTGTNWVLAWSITFGTTAQNNAAALTAMVGSLIP